MSNTRETYAYQRPRANESRITSTPKLRQRHAPISQWQSADTVQMLLHASISSLSWVRSLFSDKCFATRIFDQKASLQTYTDYLNSPSIEHDLQRSSKRTGTPMRHLCRGKGGTADRFLDQLELGVFEALRKGCLKALQLRVFEDENFPERVLETYTFTIEYATEAHEVSLAAIEVERPDGKGYAVSVVKKGYTTFMRALLDYTNHLPHLPDVKFLDTYLFFNEHCDMSYQPTGFEPAVPGHLVFPRTNEWTLATQDIRGFKTGHHSVDFVLSHLISTADRTAISEQIPELLPHEVQYPAWVDIFTPAEADQIEFDLDDVGSRRSLCTQELLRDTSSGSASRRGSDGLANKSLLVDHISSSTSQVVRDLSIKARLQKLQHPSTQASGLVPTQPRHDTPPAEQEGPTAETENALEPFIPSRSSRLCYSIAISESFPHRKSRRFAVKLLQAKNSNMVRCACNRNTEEDEMIMCDRCGTWQHAECHGYFNASDKRLPENHLCYNCLLHERDPDLLREMEHLAFRRRAVDTIKAVGWHGDDDLSKRLGCPLEAATEITIQMRRKGYLLDRPNKKRRCLQNPRAIIDPDMSVQQRLFAEFFEPTLAIRHYLYLPIAAADGNLTDKKAADRTMNAKRVIHPASDAERRIVAPKTPHQAEMEIKHHDLTREAVPVKKTLNGEILQHGLESDGWGPQRSMSNAQHTAARSTCSVAASKKALKRRQTSGRQVQQDLLKNAAVDARIPETPFPDTYESLPRDRKRARDEKARVAVIQTMKPSPRKRMRASRVKNYLRVTMSS